MLQVGNSCLFFSNQTTKNQTTTMAQQTVIGVFDSAEDAQRAARELAEAGFNRDSVDVASRGAQSNASSGSSGSSASRDSDHYNASGTWVEGAADSVGRAFEGDRSNAGSTGRSGDSDHYNRSGTMVEGAADTAGRGLEQAGSGIGRFFRNLFSDDDDAYNRYSSVAERSSSILTVHVS